MKKLISILLLAFCFVCLNVQAQQSPLILDYTICPGDSMLFQGKYYKQTGIYPYSVRVISHIDTVVVPPDTFRLDTFYRDSVTSVLNLTVAHNYMVNRQVNLCNGDVYQYKGVTYTSSATVYDTLHSVQGCDSIIRLSINFHPDYFRSYSDSICYGTPYIFGKRSLTQSGVYRDTFKTVAGCDSVIELHLTVNKGFLNETYDTICKGMTYYWHGKTYTNSGHYKIDDLTIHGCDSIYELHLFVRLNILRETSNTICNGDSCLFRGKFYKTAGVYDDTIFVPGSCDTVYRLRLTVHNHVQINRSVTICGNDTLHWAGKHYTQSGTYYDTLPGKLGECDTFSVINLTVLPVPVTTISQSICKNKPFYYRGKQISKAGVYVDVFVAVNGCDSIVRLVVNENPSFELHDTAYICEGDSNIFFDQVLTNAGTYTSYQLTKDGCDSIFVRDLVVNKKDTINKNVHRCDHQPYNFFGTLISQPGKYTHTLTNRFGCDSLIILEYDTTPYLYVERAFICEGDTYPFHGKTFSTQGSHYVSFDAQYDCDSTYKLILTVGRRYEFVTDTALCKGQPFFWRGRQYTKSGTYTDSFATVLGCDSVYVLNLTITQPKKTSKVVTFCQGDSLYFDGRLINRSCNIDDTLRSLSGCDSIVQYRFNMLPSFHNSDTIDLCIGSSYYWHGKRISNSGVYWDSLKTINGCDSVFELTVRGVHSQTISLSATICNGEYYDFNGKHIYTTGTYYDTIYNVQGCADIFVLDLTVNPTYLLTDYVTLCSNQGFWYKGIYIDRPGVYYDSLKTTLGCDSVLRLVVNRAASFFYSDTARIYQGATYNFRGRTLSIGGTYYDSLKSVDGCDSIYQLVLHVTPHFHSIEYATICDNDYYNFRGRMLNTPGVYFDSLKTFNGCDSIYELHLSVNPTYFFSTTHTECYGNSIYHRGRHITKPGVYYDSLYTINGCDSVYRLVFNWSDTYLFEDTATMCKGDHHNFRGRDLTAAGIYYDSLKTQQGCDSIYKLTLIVKNHFYAEINDTICDGDVYDFHGRKINVAGTYYDSIKTQQGCDSVYKLTLSKFPRYEFTTVIEQCYGQKWQYRGMTIDKPGVYYDSLISSQGCDSVYKLVYTWLATYHFYDTVNICIGDHYNFRGRDISKAGHYYDSLKTYRGCDSIYHVYLNVVKVFHDVKTVHICSNEYYNFRGTSLNKSGTYFDSIKNSYGCDSIYELRLTILPEYLLTEYIEFCQGSSYKYKGQTITRPGVYYDSLKTQLGCDSVIKLIVNYAPRYLFVDTATICAGSSYHWRGRDITLAGQFYDSLRTRSGCDSIYKLVLTVVQPFYDIQYVDICSNESYNFHGRHLTKSGTYFDSLKDIHGCDSIYELRLTIKPHYLIDNFIESCYGNTITYRGKQIDKPGIYYDSLLTHDGCDSVYRLIFSWKSTYLFTDSGRICANGSYNFRGRTLTKPGVYYDSLTTVNGCDSVYKFKLTVYPVSHNIIDTTICDYETFAIRGIRKTQSGTYHDSLTDVNGCDSIITYNLTVNKSYLHESRTTLCHGSDLFIRGIHITQAGTYYDSMKTVRGCDSVFKIVVSWAPTYMIVDTAVHCGTNPYVFRGRSITGSGIYYDSLKTAAGCDSIYKLILTVVHPFHDVQYGNICSNQTYNFRGRVLDTTGIYYDSLKGQFGCDSIYELRLTVNPAYLEETHTSRCHGSDIYFRGRHITKPGTYYDTMRTIHGCDSVFKMVFTWNPTYLFVDTVRRCNGSSYNFRGRNVTSTGIYYDSLTTVAGCDSIFKLVFYSGYSYYDEVPLHLCTDDVYYHHGHRVTQSGIYWDSLTTTVGCDSVIKYTITVDSAKFTPIHADICSNDVYYRSDGSTVNKTGIYYDTLHTTLGCDSIIQLVLNVHADQLFEETKEICYGNYYNWRGRRLTNTGVYWDSLTSIHGCDSIYKLNLTNRSYYTEIDTTICNNVPFRFNNKFYTATGIYYDTLKTVLNCDSVFKIDLKINPNYNIVRHITICDTDFPIPFAGTFLSQTGVYHDTTTTLLGCDSINTLYLTVVPTYVQTEDTICEDEIYSWRGKQYTQPGLYTDTVRDQTEAHCDVIYALRLHTVQKTNLYSFDIASYICADDIEYSIAPRYTGTKPDAYTIRYTSADIAKSSDIINANFTSSPIQVPLPLSVDGDSLRPDSYTGTLELFNRVCDANPMSIDFTLNIRYPSYIVDQHWNDVVAILNSTYNGGYTFSKYEWYVNDILIQSITGSYMYLPNLRTGDKIEIALTREGEGYSVMTCPIWMQDLSSMEVSEYPVAVEGTILRYNSQAHIIATAAGTYSLYTSTGALVTSGTFTADSETLVTLPPVAGIYFLNVVVDNEPRTFKLLVQ